MGFFSGMKHYLGLLLLTVFASFGGSQTALAGTQTNPKISVQLWSVKDDVAKDFAGSLKQLAAMGFKGVEFAGDFGPYASNPQGLKDFLEGLGLEASGAHLGFDKFKPENFHATVAFYKTLNCKNLIIPWDDRAGSKEGILKIAAELSALSLRLQAYGIQIGYHNHDREMGDIDGQTYWDMLALATPREVILQQDVGWTTYAGKDPTAYVKKYPGRTITTHYKAKFLKGTSGVTLIGQDSINWKELIRANSSVGGTQWLVVEQEEYPKGLSAMQSVAASMKGLQKIMGKKR